MISMASVIRLSLPLTLLLAAPAGSSVAPGIDVRHAPLSDVIHTYYQVMSNAPYVVCPSVTGSLGRVSVRAPQNMTRQALRTLLRVNGFSLRVENGIDVICDAQQSAGTSVSSSTTTLAGVEPYGPPSTLSNGSPVDPRLAVQMPPVAPLSAPEAAAPTPPAPSARLVYRVRHRAAEELLPMLQSLQLGTFSVLGLGTGRSDGSTSNTLGGQAGDTILWSGAEDVEEDVREILAQIDQPAARAYVEIAAIAVSDVESRSRSLSLIGDLLGIGSSLGSAGGGISVDVGGLKVNFDALETSRKLRVVKRWSGFVTSGRNIETLNGGTVPVVSNITESSTGRVTQGVSYQPTGLSMTVTPTVLSDTVRLAVDFKDQSVAGGSSSAPSFETRSLRADMELCFGCVSIISSLDDHTVDRGRSSFLGLLPLGSNRLTQTMKLVYVAYVRAPSDRLASAAWGDGGLVRTSFGHDLAVSERSNSSNGKARFSPAKSDR